MFNDECRDPNDETMMKPELVIRISFDNRYSSFGLHFGGARSPAHPTIRLHVYKTPIHPRLGQISNPPSPSPSVSHTIWPMSQRSLADFLDELGHAGELIRVEADVDPVLEVAAVTDRIVKSQGAALTVRGRAGTRYPAGRPICWGPKPASAGALHVPASARWPAASPRSPARKSRKGGSNG